MFDVACIIFILITPSFLIEWLELDMSLKILHKQYFEEL